MFEQQVARGHREDVPAHIDADLRDIQVGELLGVPAPLVRSRVPVHWIASALILLDARDILSEEDRPRRVGRG